MSPDRATPAFTALRYDVADAIATLTLDRPAALNALTIPLKTELLAAFRAIAHDRAVRAVVLTGAGRAFCAGQDLKERLEPDAAPLAVELRERYNPIIAAMRALDQPIVAAINGVAAGAGASLAFACDIRLAAEGASFVLAFGRIGLVPDSGATWFLPRLIGSARAAELALTGAALSATEAERAGLVSRVVPADELAGEDEVTGVQSWLERRFLDLAARYGLPRPSLQRVYRRDGQHVARVDFDFTPFDVIAEVEVAGGYVERRRTPTSGAAQPAAAHRQGRLLLHDRGRRGRRGVRRVHHRCHAPEGRVMVGPARSGRPGSEGGRCHDARRDLARLPRWSVRARSGLGGGDGLPHPLGVAGMSMWRTPRCERASTTADCTAGVEPMRARLADALGAERVDRRRRLHGHQLEAGQLGGRDEGVVGEVGRDRVAVLVVADLLEQRLGRALGDAAVDLALERAAG